MNSILIIVPFDNIYPPMNGGMQRCFHIMHQLAKHFELTAIIHQDKKSFLKCVDEFPALADTNIYSTKEFNVKDVLSLFPARWENAIRSRWYQRELNRPADGSLIKYYPILTQLLKEEKYDAVILENMATLNSVKIIKRYDAKVKIIYNAHNVDSNLAKAALERKEISATQYENYVDFENNLHQRIDALFTCSVDDRSIFMKMNQGKLLAEVVPNGVSIPASEFNDGVNLEDPGYILFCGSLWSIPNAEGLYWFCKKIWPAVYKQFPALKLLVVGSGKLPLKYADISTIESIVFTGPVEDVKPWYNKAALAVVPLLTGSGTRLKVLEAMGLGVPVISTTIGAEGIEYKNGENILIADKEEDFVIEIIELLNNKKKRLLIQSGARLLVKDNYDWNVIGNTMKSFLNETLK